MDETELIETLAQFEHASWARWMAYLFDKCIQLPDGGVLIPPPSVSHWRRQVETPYVGLTEREKQSDRDEVAHILPAIHAFALAQAEAAIRDVKRCREVVASIEWSMRVVEDRGPDRAVVYRACPYCGHKPSESHSATCRVSEILYPPEPVEEAGNV